MRKLQVVKKTPEDSYKTPLCSRDNSLKLKCSREKKGLMYFYDVKETKLKLDPVSRVTGIPGWYCILGIKCSDTTGVGLVY